MLSKIKRNKPPRGNQSRLEPPGGENVHPGISPEVFSGQLPITDPNSVRSHSVAVAIISTPHAASFASLQSSASMVRNEDFQEIKQLIQCHQTEIDHAVSDTNPELLAATINAALKAILSKFKILIKKYHPDSQSHVNFHDYGSAVSELTTLKGDFIETINPYVLMLEAIKKDGKEFDELKQQCIRGLDSFNTISSLFERDVAKKLKSLETNVNSSPSSSPELEKHIAELQKRLISEMNKLLDQLEKPDSLSQAEEELLKKQLLSRRKQYAQLDPRSSVTSGKSHARTNSA